MDAGHVDGTLLVDSLQDFGIELIGPVRPNVSWQAKANIEGTLSQGIRVFGRTSRFAALNPST